MLGGDSALLSSIALFVAPFLHEDVAVVMAATMMHEHVVPFGVAMGALYGGVVASDLSLFMLGRLARQWAWLRRFVKEDAMARMQKRLRRNRVLAIGVARLVPGMLFSTLVACGWFGVPFTEFILPALITSALYTAVMVFLVFKFGGAILGQVGSWGWYVLIGLVLVVAISLIQRHFLRRALVSEDDDDALAAGGRDTMIQGMPPVPRPARIVAPSEKIPPILYYIPLGLRWIWLGIKHGSLTLPALADPCIEAGGLWGESKSKCLGQIAPEFAANVATFVMVARGHDAAPTDAEVAQAVSRARAAGLEFPMIAKPDVGWQGFGVQVMRSAEDLKRYMGVYPKDANLILQRVVPYDGEAGVFYVRHPNEPTGRVVSLTLRYFPHVIGDGVLTVRELIAREPRMCHRSKLYTGGAHNHTGVGEALMSKVPADGEMVRLSFIGSIRVGGLYRDHRKSITPELSARIDAIARSMPEFYFGRFDVRFKSLDALQCAEDFEIIEVNGAGAEAIHMWDPEMPLGEAYRELIEYQDLVFEIGIANRARGFKPMSLRDLIDFTNKQNALTAQYPPSI
jgi:membrane protein DedA with SNARE-associated domain